MTILIQLWYITYWDNIILRLISIENEHYFIFIKIIYFYLVIYKYIWKFIYSSLK